MSEITRMLLYTSVLHLFVSIKVVLCKSCIDVPCQENKQGLCCFCGTPKIVHIHFQNTVSEPQIFVHFQACLNTSNIFSCINSLWP
jgi:hypothetical protein